MRNRFCFLLVLLTLAVMGQSAAAQQGVLLRYNFSEEEPAIYRTTTEMSQSMFLGGQTFENKVTQSEVNTLTRIGVTDDRNMKLKHINKRLTVNADMGPAGTFAFDSEASERDKGTALSKALNPVYEALSGAEYTITLTPSGKVKELKGYEDILETLTEDNSLAAPFLGGASQQALQESLAESFIRLDDQPVKPGDTWEVPIELELPKIGQAKGKRIYKFEGPITQDNPTLVRITVSVEVSFDFDLASDGTRITGKIATDSSTGSVRFDTEKGQVVSSNVEYTLSGDLNVKVGDRELQSTLKQTQKRSTQQLSSLPQ